MYRRTLFAFAFASCLAPTVAAQPDKPAPAPKTEPAPRSEPPTTPAAPLPEPVVTLVDAGQQEGRRELRLRPKAATAETLVMTMKMGMEMITNGEESPKMPIPPIEFTASTTVDEIDAAGDIRCSMEFTEAKTLKMEGVNEQMVAMMDQSIAIIKGVKASIVYSDRGVIRSWTFKGADENPTLKQLLESMTQSTQQMSMPLPKEAVGVGAKWEAVAEPEWGGFKQTVTSTYTLVAMTAEGCTLEVSSKQTAKEQPMSNPMLPPGATMTVKSVEGSSSGTAQIVLARATPAEVSVKSKTKMEMLIKMDGQDTTIKQNVEMELTMKGTVADTKK